MNLHQSARIRITLTLALALSACDRSAPSQAVIDQVKPPISLVQKLDTRLAMEPCIGSLHRWSRHYRYNNRANHLDKNLIWIDFIAADRRSEAAGISIDPPGPIDVIELDDRPDKIEAAYGEYDARRNAIRWWCNANDPSPQPKSLILTL